MFRRGLFIGGTLPLAPGLTNLLFSSRNVVNLGIDARDDLTRNFNKAREEVKGQALDLADMCGAARATHKSLQDAHSRHAVDDKAFRSKMTTLNATFKAYNSRLSNLQNEAKAIQNDTDRLLKLLWKDVEGTSSTTTTASSSSSRSSSSSSSTYTTKVETVEAEVVEEKLVTPQDSVPSSSSSSNVVPDTEVELEIETVEADPIDEMSITDITKELHEKNINFSDCLDAKSLRRRYREFKEGKTCAPEPKKATPPRAEQSAPPKNVYQDPSYQHFVKQHMQSNSGPANTTATGVVADDPFTQRKQIDPMRLVGEMKDQLAKENNVPAHMIDLYCGQLLMDDSRRMYEYPGLAKGERINAVGKGQSPPPN